jgi:2'-5' RNA ligase
MRLFVSVDLDGLADAAADAHDRLPDVGSLRLVDPADAHVTLEFLGEVDPDRRDDLEGALASAVDDAGVDPFRLTVGGYGVFPSLEYISVIWLGVSRGSERLADLHESLEAETTALGYDGERHDFTPHVTLARMDHAAAKDEVQRLVRENDPEAGAIRVEELRLKKSTLTDEGPEYETVERFPL